MSITRFASRTAEIMVAYRFLKLLTTKWENTEAFKAGILDKNGKILKRVKELSSEEKKLYPLFDRMVFGVKRLIPNNKVAQLSTFATALYFLKETFDMSDETIKNVLQEAGIEVESNLKESTLSVFLLEGVLRSGEYRLKNPVPLTETSMAQSGDVVEISPGTIPSGSIMGLDVYTGRHRVSGNEIYLTLGDLKNV